MPFLAPLIPLVFTELTALPAELGGVLAPMIGDALLTAGLPTAIAGPMAGFLSPEIIGGGLGAAFGGTKGLEEGLLGGATLGGGFADLGQLAGGVASTLGAPAGASSTLASSIPLAAQAATPFIEGAMNAPSMAPSSATPVNTITPAPAAPALALPGGGGASGLNLEGNTAPQVGPWVKNFWGGMSGSQMTGTGNKGPAPATGQSASATQQQQFVPSP